MATKELANPNANPFSPPQRKGCACCEGTESQGCVIMRCRKEMGERNEVKRRGRAERLTPTSLGAVMFSTVGLCGGAGIKQSVDTIIVY